MARASALHAEGHRFDSDILHHILNPKEVLKQENNNSSFKLKDVSTRLIRFVTYTSSFFYPL